ncbi:MAG: hypothetical protein KC496_09265 [Anaerolineae bacterium]|nr:hypothetical protein [Anaerolineae bacterium]
MAENRISVGWGDADHRLLVWIFEPYWQEEDFIEALQLLKKFCADETCRYILVDYRNATPPLNIIPLIRYGVSYWPKPVRRVVVISERRHWRKLFPLAGAIMQVFAPYIDYVETVDEAYSKLHLLLNGGEFSHPATTAKT